MANDLDHDDVARQLIDTARRVIEQTGLRLGLDHISYEEVIRDAGVPRATAYRRWPSKSDFLDTVLLEIARATAPAGVIGSLVTRNQIRRVAVEHIDELRSPEFRHHLAIELIRRGSFIDFRMIRSTPEWRTYLALHTGFQAIADATLRAEIQSLIADAETRFVGLVAQAYGSFADLLGYRVRAGLPGDLVTAARLTSALMRGLVVMSLAAPALADERHPAAPYGALDTTDWSLAALGVSGLIQSWFEPDPDIVWDDDRLDQLRAVLEG